MSARYHWQYSGGLFVRTACFLGLWGSLVVGERGWAQIVPDNTLGAESSTVTTVQTQPPNISSDGPPVFRQYPQIVIEGGAQRTPEGQGDTTTSSNLFHSFDTFNVDGEAPVFLNLPGSETLDFLIVRETNIENVIIRVTGGNASTIDGLLGLRTVNTATTSGGDAIPAMESTTFGDSDANLFLLNPNGVIFGPDSRLEIGGSLTISGRNALFFADGSAFRSAAESGIEGLTISTPLGVQQVPAQEGFTPQVLGDVTISASNNELSIPRELSIVSRNIEVERNITTGGNTILTTGSDGIEGASRLLIQDAELNVGDAELTIRGDQEVALTRTNLISGNTLISALDIGSEEGQVTLTDTTLDINQSQLSGTIITVNSLADAVDLTNASLNFEQSNIFIQTPDTANLTGAQINTAGTISINATNAANLGNAQLIAEGIEIESTNGTLALDNTDLNAGNSSLLITSNAVSLQNTSTLTTQAADGVVIISDTVSLAEGVANGELTADTSSLTLQTDTGNLQVAGATIEGQGLSLLSPTGIVTTSDARLDAGDAQLSIQAGQGVNVIRTLLNSGGTIIESPNGFVAFTDTGLDVNQSGLSLDTAEIRINSLVNPVDLTNVQLEGDQANISIQTPDTANLTGAQINTAGTISVNATNAANLSNAQLTAEGIEIESTNDVINLNNAALNAGDSELSISAALALDSAGASLQAEGISITLPDSSVQFTNSTLTADQQGLNIAAGRGVTLNQTQLSTAAGGINLNAGQNSVELSNTILNADQSNIGIQAARLNLQDGSVIRTANPGSISITADSVVAEPDSNSDIFVTESDDSDIISTLDNIEIEGGEIQGFVAIAGTSDANTLQSNQTNDIALTSEALETEEASIEESDAREVSSRLDQAAEGARENDGLDPAVTDASLAEAPDLEPVVASCVIDQGDADTFVVTGRTGLPPQAGDLSTSRAVNVPWVTANEQSSAVEQQDDNLPRFSNSSLSESAPAPLIEAQSLVVDSQGNAYFVASVEPSAKTQSQGLAAASALCTAYRW